MTYVVVVLDTARIMMCCYLAVCFVWDETVLTLGCTGFLLDARWTNGSENLPVVRQTYLDSYHYFT